MPATWPYEQVLISPYTWSLRNKKVAGSNPIRRILTIYLILSAALGPEVHLASNRNEYQKQKNASGE
jgi:hypothetical protein